MSLITARAHSNSLNGLPLFQAAAAVFSHRSSAADRLVGQYRQARDAVQGWAELDRKACAQIAIANTHNPAWKRKSQAEAFSHLNRVRAARRANYRALDAARDALLALDFDTDGQPV